MTKRIFFILGAIAGFLFAEILRRKRMERLKVLEANDALQKEINAEADASWQKELERISIQLKIHHENCCYRQIGILAF